MKGDADEDDPKVGCPKADFPNEETGAEPEPKAEGVVPENAPKPDCLPNMDGVVPLILLLLLVDPKPVVELNAEVGAVFPVAWLNNWDTFDLA